MGCRRELDAAVATGVEGIEMGGGCLEAMTGIFEMLGPKDGGCVFFDGRTSQGLVGRKI